MLIATKTYFLEGFKAVDRLTIEDGQHLLTMTCNGHPTEGEPSKEAMTPKQARHWLRDPEGYLGKMDHKLAASPTPCLKVTMRAKGCGTLQCKDKASLLVTVARETLELEHVPHAITFDEERDMATLLVSASADLLNVLTQKLLTPPTTSGCVILPFPRGP